MNLSSMMDKLRSESIVDASTLSGMRQASERLFANDSEARSTYMARSLERIIRTRLVGFESEAVTHLAKALINAVTNDDIEALSLFDVLRCSGALGYSGDRLARNLARWLEKSAGISGGYELSKALAEVLPHFDGHGDDPALRKDRGNLRPPKSKRRYVLSEESTMLYPASQGGVELSRAELAAMPSFSMDSIIGEFYQKQADKIRTEIGFDLHEMSQDEFLAATEATIEEADDMDDLDYSSLADLAVDDVEIAYPEALAFGDDVADEEKQTFSRLRRKVKNSLPPRIVKMLNGRSHPEERLENLPTVEVSLPEAPEVIDSKIELAPLPQPRSYPLFDDEVADNAKVSPIIGTPKPGPWEKGGSTRSWYEPEEKIKKRRPWPVHLTYKTVAIAAIAGIFALSALLAPTFINVNAGSIGQLGIFSVENRGEKKTEEKPVIKVRQEGIPVLLYHHIRQQMPEDDSLAGVIISVDNFTRQMDYLKKNGYSTITLVDLYNHVVKGSELPDQAVLITFDDSYKDNFYYAYPILKERGFKAAIFAITDRTTVEPVPLDLETEFVQKMSMEEMRLSADIFEFGSHTNNLHSLGADNRSALITATREEILKDMMISKKLLDTDYFAYPYGQYTPETIKYLQETGYIMAFINQPGYIKTGDDVYTLPRIEIRGDISMERFAEIVEGKF